MAIRGEFDLELGKFNAKLDEAVNKTKRAAKEMKKDTADVGESLGSRLAGNVSGDLAGLVGVTGGLVGTTLAAAAAFKQITSSMGDLADRAERLNETPETLQRVEGAAQLSGASVEGLSGSLLKLEKNLEDVENKAASEALERYGLSAEKLAAMPLDEKLLALADAFQGARDSGRGYADLLDLIGKSGSELIPLLSTSREELQGLMDGVNVVSDAAVAQMAAVDDRLDKFGASMSNGLKKVTYDVLNFSEVVLKMNVGLLKGKSPLESMNDAFGDIQDREQDTMTQMDGLQARREERARNLAKAREEAAAKKAEEKDKKETKDLESAHEKVNQRKLGGLEGADKLPAIAAELDKIFSAMEKKGGVWFGKTTDGLEKWAAALEKNGNKELAAEALAMQEKALALQQEARRINEQLRKEAADEGKKKEDELKNLREKASNGAVKLMTPKEQAAHFRQELADSLGMEVKTGDDVKAGLQRLRDEWRDAQGRGDNAAEKDALLRLDRAQQDAGALAGLSNSGSRAATAGETTSVLSVLTGGGSNLVLDETRQQGQTLKDIARILQSIDDKARGGAFGDDSREGGFGIDLFR